MYYYVVMQMIQKQGRVVIGSGECNRSFSNDNLTTKCWRQSENAEQNRAGENERQLHYGWLCLKSSINWFTLCKLETFFLLEKFILQYLFHCIICKELITFYWSCLNVLYLLSKSSYILRMPHQIKTAQS